MVFKGIINFLKKKKTSKENARKSNSKKRNERSKKLESKKPKVSLKRKAPKKEKLVAYATHYFSKIKVAVFKMKDTLKINDKIHIKGYTTNFTQIVGSMQIEHNPIKIAKKGQEIGLLVKGKVRHKDKVYKT